MMTEMQRKSYPGLLFSDPAFLTEQTPGLRLNIFLNESQLIFSIVNQEQKVLLHLQSFNFFQFNNQAEFYSTIHDVLDKEDLFNLTYQSVYLYIYNGLNTLIPIALFDINYLDDYIHFNFDIAVSLSTEHDVLEKEGMVNVYGIAHELKKIFENKFKGLTINHNTSALISYLTNNSNHDDMVYVYVQPQRMQIFIYRQQQPIFVNSFQYTTPEDFIYFVLYTYQQLKLEPETTALYLMGEIVKESALYEQLYKYIRHIHFIKRPAALQVHSNFNIPSHFYFNIFCAGI